MFAVVLDDKLYISTVGGSAGLPECRCFLIMFALAFYRLGNVHEIVINIDGVAIGCCGAGMCVSNFGGDEKSLRSER